MIPGSGDMLQRISVRTSVDTRRCPWWYGDKLVRLIVHVRAQVHIRCAVFLSLKSLIWEVFSAVILAVVSDTSFLRGVAWGFDGKEYAS